MAEPFLGEIRRIAFPYPPRGWALCNGAILRIANNQALFSLLGTVYGGDGVTNFALPDLRGRSPIHSGAHSGIAQGTVAGESIHTLTVAELPPHTHPVAATSDEGSASTPTDGYWAAVDQPAYGTAPVGAMAPSSIGNAGGSQPHENMSPYLALHFIIAIDGIYPTRD
ncbi:phage tail protein [Microbacterium sp. NPDC055903]